MSSDPDQPSDDLPTFGEEPETAYSLEVVAELAGLDSSTVILYREAGFIRPVSGTGDDDAIFDAECLRQLRRIEHLRATCGVNETGLKLILDLLHEVEILRQERRQALR
jgi:DNA-binding transcriptional MerR regulator